MLPWMLVADPTGDFFRWLVAYSALLGAVGGVLIADYFVIRRMRLDHAGLYKKDGPYWYTAGFNASAIIAMLLGIAPCVPGFLAAVSESWRTSIPPLWSDLYHYAWFISFGVSFISYFILMRTFTNRA
jgi:NCS1 family nucleobase:cation symporter-1